MQKDLDAIKDEVTTRIYGLYMAKFGGNKLRFAKAVGCDEKAIRLLFDKGQGMTLNLLFKISLALEIEPSKLLEGLSLKKED